MKNTYLIYRGRTSLIYDSLSQEEKDLIQEYKNKLLMTASEKKVNQGLRFLLQFRDIIEKPLTNVEDEDLIHFWGLVKTSEHQHNTKVMIKKSVRRFLRWYCKKNNKSDNLLEGLKVGSFKPNRKKVNKSVLLKPHEIQTMLHTAESLRDKALLILLYESASRPQELKDLKWKDIDWDEQEVHLDSSKTERERDIPIKESIIHLKRWKQEWSYPSVQEDDYIFPSQKRDCKLTTERINTIVKTIANRSGIDRNITSYTFRHSRLTDIYKLGVKGIEHNKFAGHKEGSIQQVTYSHIDNEDMKEEVLKKVYHIEEIGEEQNKILETLQVDIGNIKKELKLLKRKIKN